MSKGSAPRAGQNMAKYRNNFDKINWAGREIDTATECSGAVDVGSTPTRSSEELEKEYKRLRKQQQRDMESLLKMANSLKK